MQAQLVAQDSVFMTTPKEPNFFSDDDVYAKGWDWYRGLYNDAAPGDMTGEASTHYTKLPTYPQTLTRMQNHIAPPKVIYLIRNPVQRSVSHFIHEWSENRMENDIEAAYAGHSELVDYGRYSMQIQPYIDAYGAENVLLSSLETLKSDTTREFARITAFLGLPASCKWVDDMAAQNVSAQRSRPLPFQSLLVDNPVATMLRRALVPKGLRTAIRESRTMKTRPELTPALKARLEDTFKADREKLAQQFPGNAALNDAYPFA